MKLKEKKESLKKEYEEAYEKVKVFFKERLENYQFTTKDKSKLLHEGGIKINENFIAIISEDDEVSRAYCTIRDLTPEEQRKSTIEKMLLEAAAEVFEDCKITVMIEKGPNWIMQLEIYIK